MNEPTMADIASHVGVSRQSVSIVLREMPGASEETRRRVLQAARQLGYKPHLTASSLRQYTDRQLGVAFAPTHATEPDIVEAIYPVAAQSGYRVILSAQTKTRSTEQAVEELLGYRCAAVILIGSDLSQRDLAGLTGKMNVPAVVVGVGKKNETHDVVRSDGAQGTAEMVRHLVSLGHTRIAYVHAGAMPPGAVRLQGYRAAMSAAGLAQDIVRVNRSDYTEEAGAEAARRLLRRDALPTAVATGNDQQAIGVLQVLARAGVSIPGDVSLTGFDDSRFARLSSVDLTTVGQDPQEMGKAAVAAVVRRISSPDLQPEVHLIEPRLVLRSTTSALNASSENDR